MHLVAMSGSDAGISAALRARELDPTVDVTVVVADAYPNFSICGIPYYISGGSSAPSPRYPSCSWECPTAVRQSGTQASHPAADRLIRDRPRQRGHCAYEARSAGGAASRACPTLASALRLRERRRPVTAGRVESERELCEQVMTPSSRPGRGMRC
jgi:hypothetical protein